MGQTSGIKQVQSLQHDTHEIAKPSSLNEQKNSKVTSYWVPPSIACYCRPGCHGGTWRSPGTMFEFNSQARRGHHLVAL
jgi:hypothetical protein